MVVEALFTGGVMWLWGQYGKSIVDRSVVDGLMKKKWDNFRWQVAEEKYLKRIHDQHNSTRLLGNPRPITIEDVFVDAYVLDKPTALYRFDLDRLKSLSFERESLKLHYQRRPALPLIETEKRLFILGKPGSGKTTFLKYLATQAVARKIQKTPIFVSLREWSDSGLELIPFIVQQFEICAFPDAQMVIELMLDKGDALVLLDGLDEVNQEGDKRSRMIDKLTAFANKYPETQICLTCRIAATDYSFTRFTYLEIADFNDEQIDLYIRKWYHSDKDQFTKFVEEFNKPEHVGLRELARTPLLLALLCLAYDSSQSFPRRRVDLYKEALEALFKKWDPSRNIKRDEIYYTLSVGRKEQMLARIAAENFENKTFFIGKQVLIKQIMNYLSELPASDIGNGDIDAESTLQTMETHHGLLIERAVGIYSFVHLTFQEYFTAKYVIDNSAGGTINRMIRQHFFDFQWREVFLLTASLLDNANEFILSLQKILISKVNLNLLNWVARKAIDMDEYNPQTRILLIVKALEDQIKSERFRLAQQEREKDFVDENFYSEYLAKSGRLASHLDRISRSTNFIDALVIARKSAVSLANVLGLDSNTSRFSKLEKYEPYPNLTVGQILKFAQYLYGTQILIECLHLATVSNRATIESRILLPSKN